jgi:hypothetical protein
MSRLGTFTSKKVAVRFKCNQHKVMGMAVNYKADKYAGDDAFDILVIYPDGFAWERLKAGRSHGV